MKGVRINDIHSYDDLGARVLERSIGFPEKQTAFVNDVPFMDGGYDFAVSTHRVYWGWRDVEYVFRLIGANQKEQTHSLLAWLADVSDSKIYDEWEEGWYLRGSLAEAPEIGEDVSGWFTDVTAVFRCQPYWVADEEQTITFAEGTYDFYNDGMVTTVTASPTKLGNKVSVQFGSTIQEIDDATELIEEFAPGSNVLVVSGGGVKMKYHYTRL